ncbi:hypothetical protein Hanom_Chr05g00385701 [Helianthus anomalus]
MLKKKMTFTHLPCLTAIVVDLCPNLLLNYCEMLSCIDTDPLVWCVFLKIPISIYYRSCWFFLSEVLG